MGAVGIYKITCTKNNKAYIGQSSNIERRFKEHVSGLNRSKKHNPKFTNSWSKYGQESFTFEIIEECSEDMLNEREIFWIKELHTFSNGFNATHGGDGTRGVLRSDEWREKQSKAHIGSRNAMYGKTRKHNEKLKKAVRDANRIHTDEIIYNVKKCIFEGMATSEIRKIFDISRYLIRDIRNLKSWVHIGEEFNDELDERLAEKRILKKDTKI